MLNQSREQELIKLAQSMIQAKSYSGEEEQAAKTIGEYCTANGFDEVTYDKYGNVIGVIKGNRPSDQKYYLTDILTQYLYLTQLSGHKILMAEILWMEKCMDVELLI